MGVLKQAPAFPEFKTHNIPIINLLSDFGRVYNQIREAEYLLGIEYYDEAYKEQSARLPFATRDAFINFHVSRLIIAFESYLKGALWECDNMCSGGLGKQVQNPRKEDRPLARAWFHVLPSKILPDFSLKVRDGDVYAFMERFYRDVRNQLFHGAQLENPSAYDFLQFMEVYAKLYEWIASWDCVAFFLVRQSQGRLTLPPWDWQTLQEEETRKRKLLMDRRKAAGLVQ